MLKNIKGKIIYIGKAKNLKKRVLSYYSKNALSSKTLKLIHDVTKIDTILTTSEIEAFLLEAELIKKHKPFYNIKLTDDKSYPYIEIDISDNPSVTITRKKKNTRSLYFGPYSDVKSLKIVLKLLRRIFPYQSIKNHPRKICLYNHLNLCPCVCVIRENREQYEKNLKGIRKFLVGKKEELLKNLIKEREVYAGNENFEMAKKIQEKIDGIMLITSSAYQPFHYIEKPDFYYERIKDELSSLTEILSSYYGNTIHLKRIECFDISNISGKHATGSMVVFENGERASSQYRRFKIKHKDTPDDFFMMKETLYRRFNNKSWPNPDLLVIDGGKGQVGIALQVLAQLKVKYPVVGLAKKKEIIVIPVKHTNGIEYIELKLPIKTPGINLLRRIRDEAHRFAITYHRLLRKKNFLGD